MHAIFRYYVRPVSKPSKRASVALVVKIGSVVEEDDEQGVAHIVEHLAFNATEVRSSISIQKDIIPSWTCLLHIHASEYHNWGEAPNCFAQLEL